MMKIVGRVMAVLLLLVAGLFWLAFFSPRPPLMTDPATLAGDGSALNYCELPVLDGSGKRAADIPKGNTPACNYGRFPPSVPNRWWRVPKICADSGLAWRAGRSVM
jgi:hypothetical protein